MELVKYDAACRAVAEAKTVDDCLHIINMHEAARAYAKIAKNRQMEIDALEIRIRGERQLGKVLVKLRGQKVFTQGGPGRGRHETPTTVTLKDMGIDPNVSAISQRLAKLPEERFVSELADWRGRAETMQRLDTPLQRYRLPSIVGDRQKAAVRLGRHKIDATDPFDRFRAVDGRRIADWRDGELDRIEQCAARDMACVAALRAARPIANADPLDTMEMIFERGLLQSVLDQVWSCSKIELSKTGWDDGRIAASRERRRRECAHCGVTFIMRHPSGKALRGESNEGRFCSRECSAAHRRASNSSDGRESDKT